MHKLRFENYSNSDRVVTFLVHNTKTGKHDTLQVELSEQGSTYHLLVTKLDLDEDRLKGLCSTRELIDTIGDKC